MNIEIPPGNIDPFLRQFRQPGTRFVLEAGDYETSGAWGFADLDCCMLAPACTLEGDPEGGSILSMSRPVERAGAPYFEMLTGGARTAGTSSRLSVRNLTLMPPARPTVALHLWTSRATVRNVHVEGLAGSRAVNPGEGFGILVNSAFAAAVDGHHRVEDCTVHLRPGAYACGIYVGVQPRNGVHLAASTVRDCEVVVENGGSSHCGFGINSRTTLERCLVTGCERAFFSDTSSGIDSIIRECRAVDCTIAVEFRVEQTSTSRERIIVEDSTFVFRRDVGYVAGLVLVADGAGSDGLIRDVTMRRCTLINPSPVPAYLGSASGPNVRGIVLERVLTTSGGQPWREPQLANGATAWAIS